MHPLTRQFFALGSDCGLQIFADDADEAERAMMAAMREIARIEARYSRYRTDSEVSRINAVAAVGGTVDVDVETAGLIDYASACYRKSDGLFDITSGLLRKAWNFSSGRLPEDSALDELLPRIGFDKVIWSRPQLTFRIAGMEIDFGGIGKEYAVDRAVEVCRAMGIRHGLVDLGGDIRIVGPRPDDEPWRVGIRHPRASSVVMAEVALDKGAVATSGDYERFMEVGGRRYCHILNPRTGWPAQGLSSVTVIGDDCLVAGSLATIAMLKGRDGISWLKAMGVRHVVMDDEGCIRKSE